MENSPERRYPLLPIKMLFKSLSSFFSIQFEHVPQAQNKHADALVTLASKIDIHDEFFDIQVIKKTLRRPLTLLMSEFGIHISSRIWFSSLLL